MKRYSLIAFGLLIYFSTQAQFIVNNGLEIYNSGLITTNGDWSNSSGTTILNNGVIQTAGAFVNNGTLDVSGNGGFELNLASDLDFNFGGPQIGFLKKAGNGTMLLNGTLHVKDSLDLKQGAIRLINGIDTLVLVNSGKLMSVNGFVEGLFARSGKGDFIFPVGKDGAALPIKLYKVQAEKVTVSVFDTPAGFSAGAGVDALIDFPYSWKVQGQNPLDTAAYVEINYADTLPVVANAVVVRESPALHFANMGARYIDNSAGRVTVRSYNRRLNGVFSIAQGFPTDPTTDSLALVALFDATNGINWTNNNQWKNGNINTWAGVITAGPAITGLLLSNNNLSGPIPDVLTDIQSLDTVMLSGNNITALPDFSSNPEIALLDVSDNNLDFSSLEPNADIPGFAFANQGPFGLATDSLIAVGSDIMLTLSAGGDSTIYQWQYNDADIAGATTDSLTITGVNRSNMGEYYVEATNPKLPGLTLISRPQSVKAYASISGQLKVDSANVAAAGTVTLLKVKPNAFENAGIADVNENGEYTFDKVVLDDYEVLGFADTAIYADALPTYYNHKLFWEEADTVFLNDHLDSLDIISLKKPGESPGGNGVISGTLEEEVTSGRTDRTLVNKRVEGAGVTARRVERSGRGKQTNLVLVSYVFTDENGEFNITDLPEGDYRLNLQYPGYPMDTTSDVTLTIGGPLESVVAVEAKVLDGKINVRKLTVTGSDLTEHYDVELFPNPAVEAIHLSFGYEKRNRSVELVGMTGQRYLKQTAESKKSSIPVNSFQKGIYILRIAERGKIVKSFKVVID